MEDNHTWKTRSDANQHVGSLRRETNTVIIMLKSLEIN